MPYKAIAQYLGAKIAAVENNVKIGIKENKVE
jgi:hypothetical protein